MSSILTVTVPATSRVLVDVQTVRQELGIPDSEDSVTIQRMIRAASAVIEKWCRRVFALETVQEVFRGATAECLNLARYPVASITSVLADRVTLTADEYELDAEAGQLWRVSGCRIGWRSQKATIVYTAGYILPPDVNCTLPEDLHQACITLVTSYYLGQGRDLSVRSESTDGVDSISFLDPRSGMEALLPQVAGMLDPYRRFAFTTMR